MELGQIPVRRALALESFVIVRLWMLSPAGVGVFPALRG
jgi:hypothetical protein